MFWKTSLATLAASATLATANPVLRRAVQELNEAAFEEAHQRDDTATRAFSNVQIKTADGKCLFVDKLSGDFRANLTPVQVADCGSTDGQEWDVITAGKHNNQPGQALIVSTLTQACFSFDPRRPADSQVHLFSCGGRADGGGEVTNSQLFAFDGKAGPLSLQPQNQKGTCFTVQGNTISFANCNAGAAAQQFTFGGATGGNNQPGKTVEEATAAPTTAAPVKTEAPAQNNPFESAGPSTCGVPNTVTVINTVTVTANSGSAAIPPVASEVKTTEDNAAATETSAAATTSADATSAVATTIATSVKIASTTAAADVTTADVPKTTAPPTNAPPTDLPADGTPVSRAGGKLDRKAAEESQQFDPTAKRDVESVNLRAADGRCLSIDPTAGDFRQNLIPVQLAACNETPNQKFDIVTKGKHNDGNLGGALLINVLMNGCLNFDGRRAQDDTVIMFSCGGRADGESGTTDSQLFPFVAGSDKILLNPFNAKDKTCLVAGADKLGSVDCNGDNSQEFDIVAVL